MKFQSDRGLHPTGVCDEATWRAIVEAGYQLGDRLLLLSAPNLRGDDVAELQSALALIGFHPGRVDGIFGPETAQALRDFQVNSGVVVDGVCGPGTIQALQLLARQTGTGPGVATLKELETITANARSMSDLRVVVGQFGGLSAPARQLVQAMRHRSATVIATDEPDAVAQATTANRFRATVYIGFETHAEPGLIAYYFSVPQFESAAGRSLANLIATCHDATNRDLVSPATEVRGMRLSILRETKMPAVLLAIPADPATSTQASDLIDSILTALEIWVQNPGFSTDSPE